MEHKPPHDLMWTAERFGRLLRDARQERGWSGVDLADLSGIDQSTVSKFESGKRFPTERARRRLEEAFGWPAGRIVRMAGLVAEPQDLDDYLAGRPDLTAADRRMVIALIHHLEGRNRPRPAGEGEESAK